MGRFSDQPIRRDMASAYKRGTGESVESYLDRVKNYLEFLESTSGVHTGWYTHNNLQGCWVCNTLLLCRYVAQELEATAMAECDCSGSEVGDVAPTEMDYEREEGGAPL